MVPQNQDVKATLSKVYYIDKEIRALAEIRDSMEKDAVFLRAIDYSKDRVSSEAGRGGVEDTVIRIADAQGRVTGKINELIEAKQIAMQIIEGLPEGPHKAVMYNRYILLKTWESIAVDLNYSYRHVLRLHGDALTMITNKEKRHEKNSNTI